MTQGNELLPKQHHRPTQQRNHHYRTRSSNNSRPTSAGSTTSIRNGYDSNKNNKNDGSKQRQTTQSRYRSNHHQQKKRSSLSDLSRPKKRKQHRPSLEACSSSSSINIVHNNASSSSSKNKIKNNSKFKSEHSQRNRITVAVRVRPLNSKEMKERRVPVVRVSKQLSGADPLVQISRLAKRGAYLKSEAAAHWEYGFDYAFNEKTKQETVYENTVKPLVSDLLSGINSTIFAYGATGAGKTHTMMGTAKDVGMIPRALKELFHDVNMLKQEFKRAGQKETIQIELSYLEVYNEKIYDLLNPGAKKSLEPREDTKKGIVIVAGLEQRIVHDRKDVMDAVKLGNHNRKMSATAANKVSSRSHAVLQVFVTRTKPAVPGKSCGRIIRGVMNLIDLAGSERASATNNRGMRLIEGANINKSLLALANCINALSNKSNGNLRNGGGKGGGSIRAKYRDSKLTHLLKSSLEGNCAMVMIAAINPSNHTFEESHNTLKYANRAKQIRITATAHEKAFSPAPKVKAKLLAEENAKLKMELMALRNANNDSRLSMVSNTSTRSSSSSRRSSMNENNNDNTSFQSDANSSIMDSSIIDMIDTSIVEESSNDTSLVEDTVIKENNKTIVLDENVIISNYKILNDNNPKEAWINEPTTNMNNVKPKRPSHTQNESKNNEHFTFDMSLTSLSNAPSMSEFELPIENFNHSNNAVIMKLRRDLKKLQNNMKTFAKKEEKYKKQISTLVQKNQNNEKEILSKHQIIENLKKELKSIKLENKVLINKVNASMNETARKRRDELLALKAKVDQQRKVSISTINDNNNTTLRNIVTNNDNNDSILENGNTKLMKKRKELSKSMIKQHDQENRINKEDIVTEMPPPKKRKKRNRRKSLIPVLKLNIQDAF